MDVTVGRHVSATPAQVAAVMFDPRCDPEWLGGAKSVADVAPDPVAIGSRTKRIGGFLGRKFAWVTQVREFEPDRLLSLDFVEGPMSGSVTYRIEPEGQGSLVSIRNHGTASFSMPGMAWVLKRSVAKDLDRLAHIIEGSKSA